MIGDLSGTRGLVVGGAGGIGGAHASGLRGRGAQVIVADLEETGDTWWVDVADPDSVAALGERLRREGDRLDWLVYAVGAVTVGRIEDAGEADWARLLDLNLTGLWRTVRACLPSMGEGSSILAISSGAGLRPLPELTAYSAAKAGVIGFCRALAGEVADRGIRVNCLCPGVVDTAMARAAQAARSASVAAGTEARSAYLITRDGTAEEIADAGLSLLLNGYATGSTLAVDGGRTLH